MGDGAVRYLILFAISGILFCSCSSDPVSNNGGTPNTGSYTVVYENPGILDSINCGSIMTVARLLGNLDLTNSDSIKISLQYIASNTSSYGIRIFFHSGGNIVDLINVTIPGNQNSYTNIEFTLPSPGVNESFFYILSSGGVNCYLVVRNISISKKTQ